MIERVARALCKNATYPGYNAETQDEIWLRNKRIYMSQSRAAIEAMRQPTLEMQQPMDDLEAEQWLEVDAFDVWQSMIEAALEEGLTDTTGTPLTTLDAG